MSTLLHAFEYETIRWDTQTADYYHPGRSARAVINNDIVAQFGQLHPEIAASRKLRQDVFIAELYVDALYKPGLRKLRYEPIPRHPAVERDFSFVFADSITFEQMQRAISSLGLSELRSFVPAEIFRGGSIGSGKYSILLRATFQSRERTLREDEVAHWSAQIIKTLEAVGGILRTQ